MYIFKKSGAPYGLGHHEGEIVDLSVDNIDELIKLKVIEKVETEVETEVETKPKGKKK